MDGRTGEPTFQEAVDAERDEGELVIGIQCYGCDYQLWTHVRLSVPTEVRCFRQGCGAVTEIRLESRISELSPWTEGGKKR